MKIGDTIKLALGGYDTASIKELGEISKTLPEVIELAKTGKSLGDIKALMELADSEETPGNSADQEQDKSDPTPDYRKLYEDQKAELDKLKNTVSEIQKANAGKDISGATPERDPFEQIADIIGLR